MINEANIETVHILAQHIPLAKDIDEARIKLLRLGLSESEANAMIERELHGGIIEDGTTAD